MNVYTETSTGDEVPIGPLFDEDASAPIVVKSEAECRQVKTENLIEPNIPPDPLEIPCVETEETECREIQLLPITKQCANDPEEDIELQNVLDLENVLKRMHVPRMGLERMEVDEEAFPLGNELERVMRLENVLRRVNGNLAEFKSVEEALRKIHETVLLDEDDNESDNGVSEINRGVNQMSDVEVALQNEPLILNDNYRESFSTIEEWASSQLKQQEVTSSAPPKDGSSFSKSEGEVMKSAKILFAKKTKTLFRWLHPKDTKADLKQRVDRAWDRLSPNETEFYYSQVLGPFNHRQVKPMINPRIFELLNIPEALRPAPGTQTRTDADAISDLTTDESNTGKVRRSQKTPKPKIPGVGVPRRKRGPYKKTLGALETTGDKEKRKKRNRSSSSSCDREYFPGASSKRSRDTKKKTITQMGKLRLKFFKMKTSKLPESSDSDDCNDEEDEEEDYDSDHPYQRHFGRVTVAPDSEISVEVTQGLEECDKLLDSDSSM